ncbi:hypothetical protein OSB04_024611 [Centaurea solstitialis]|uniref:Uncharacterized protein n=1 Tax=Centaurea solstitialis TaxID=347529 RepID=A0AA38SLH1_9ASTR|nr:hypothetical protein OSB04_024611 [Centaurea solstitialis]
MISIDEINLENFNNSDDIQVTSTMSASQMDPPKVTKSKSKKRKVEEEDVTTSKITAAISDVANAIRETSKVLSLLTLYLKDLIYLGTKGGGGEIYNELNTMGLAAKKLSCAYLFLVENPDKAHTFFGCPLPMRMSLLKDMLGEDY